MNNQPKYRCLRTVIAVAMSMLITGYWLFAGALHYWQLHKVKAEIHQILKTNIPDSLIVSFFADQLHEPGVKFIHSREFEVDSYKYDIVDTLATEDQLVVRCIRDDKEKLVEAQLLSLYGHTTKAKKKSGNRNFEILKCSFLQENVHMRAIDTAPVYGSVCLAGDYLFFLHLESPPPEDMGSFLILS